MQFFPRTSLKIIKGEICNFLNSLLNPIGNFAIFNPSTIKIVADYYGYANSGHQINVDKANLGYGFVHYALIRNLKPDSVLCIGSGRGLIPAICALACKDNQRGMVNFVDAGFDNKSSKNWGGDGFWKRVSVEKHFSLLGLDGWINTYVMTSREYAKKFEKKTYGFIYIDGDHSYSGVKLDYKLFWPRLEKLGIMAFHDVTVKEWGELKDFGVWKLWKEIKNKNKFIFPLEQSGLGIIQKRGGN